MPVFVGHQSKAAFQKDTKQSVYGVAEVMGANDQIPFISADIQGQRGNKAIEYIGNAGKKGSFKVSTGYAGNMLLPLFYQGGIEDMLCFGFGFENANLNAYSGSPHNYAVGVYKHIFECDHKLSRVGWGVDDDRLASGSGGGTWVAADQKVRSFTLGFKMGPADWRYLSTMINQLTFSGDTEKTELSLGLVSYDRNVSAAGYNSSAWTLRSGLSGALDNFIIKPIQARFEVGLTGADYARIYPTSWEVVISNNLAVDHRYVGENRILQPVRSGLIEVTFKFELPRYEVDTYLTYKENNTGYVSIEFIGVTITGAYTYRFGLYMPSVDFIGTSEPNIAGAEVMNHTIAGKANKSYTSLPSPTSGVWSTTEGRLKDVELKKAGPIIAMIQNGNSTNILDAY